MTQKRRSTNNLGISLTIVSLIFLRHSATAVSQEKVAQGEYQMRDVSDSKAAKTATRWVLFATSSGGYHLESAIENPSSELRVVQVEDLDNKLVPTAIGYELYRSSATKPHIVLRCQFVRDAVTCGGRSEKGTFDASEPYKCRRPFWFWVEGLLVMDMPWLLDGAINMADLKKGRSSLTMVIVSGGSAGPLADAVTVAGLKAATGAGTNVIAPNGKEMNWHFRSEEESPLDFVGAETIAIDGTNIAARHYILEEGDERRNIWIAGEGLLVKIDEFVLTNYKQKRKLIPELSLRGALAPDSAEGK